MRQLLKSKKGAEMTIGTIIIIILALVVLIFLIYSFMKGGGSLMDTLGNFFAGGPNVDTIKNSCQAACTTQSAYSYCTEVRTLKVSDKSSYLGSCKTFSGLPVAGVASCPDIDCGAALPVKCGEKEAAGGSWQKTCTSTSTASAEDLTSKVGDSAINDIKVNPYCCKVSTLSCKNKAADPCVGLSQASCALPVCIYTAEDATAKVPASCKLKESGCAQITTKLTCESATYSALCQWN